MYRSLDRVLSRWAAGLLLAVALIFAPRLAPALAGQSLSGATAVVRVTDESGLPLPGTRVVVTRTADGVTRTGIVPQSGAARFLDLTPGSYTVLAEQIGFVPKLVTGVVLRADGTLEVPLSLAATPTPPQRVDTLAFAGGPLADAPSFQATEISADILNDFPFPSRRPVDLLAFSTAAGDGFSIEGLPGALAGIRLDGTLTSTLDGYSLTPGTDRGISIPLSMIGHGTVVTGNPDVEWAGTAGGSLDLFTSTGRGVSGVDGYARWSGAGLIADSPGGARPLDQALEAGAGWGGPFAEEAAHASLGVEVMRLTEQPLLSSGVLPVGVNEIAQGVHDLSTPSSLSTNALAGFGSVAWQLSTRSRFEAEAGFGILPETSLRFRAPGAPASRPVEGSDFRLGTSFTSYLGRESENAYHEGRVSIESVSRSFAAMDAFGQPGPTWISDDAVVLGPGDIRESEFSRLVLRASETFHLRTGAHRLKGGVTLLMNSAEVAYGHDSDIRVASQAQFGNGEGAVVRSTPSVNATPSTLGGGLFAQDVWSPSDDLELLAGARFDFERLPDSFESWSEPWTIATGLDNRAEQRVWWRISPRFGFTWTPGERDAWVVSGSAGLYSGNLDPMLLASWLSGWGGERVYREVTGVEGWPVPGLDPRNDGLPGLTLLNTEYEPPRSIRAEIGLAGAIDPNTTLRLFGSYRRTDFLARIFDLNQNPDPTGSDQFGRPVIGQLGTRSGLLRALGDSYRRFGTIDHVFAIEMDGVSKYTGVTAALERQLPGGSELFAAYTFSRTIDNLFGGGAYAEEWAPAPLLPESAGDWAESTSDYDIPHRAVLGADLVLPPLANSRLAVLYRFRSGTPFTAGFRSGVDANADGYFGNDPAFVDRTLPGADGVISSWSCLSADVGSFATRNGCRTDAVHTLDARLTVGVVSSERFRGSLLIEAIDLLGAERSGVDTALYLLAPGGSVTQSGTSVTVPLVANPAFGERLETVAPGRMFRIGFRMEL